MRWAKRPAAMLVDAPGAMNVRRIPHQSTFCRLFQKVDALQVEATLLAIQEQGRGRPPKEDLIVLDGKEPKHGGQGRRI